MDPTKEQIRSILESENPDHFIANLDDIEITDEKGSNVYHYVCFRYYMRGKSKLSSIQIRGREVVIDGRPLSICGNGIVKLTKDSLDASMYSSNL